MKFLQDLLWQVDSPFSWPTVIEALHVDLGAGRVPRNPFGATKVIATDMHASHIGDDGISYVQSDLTRVLPFDSNSIDSFSAYDVLEHIPRWERHDGQIVFPFIHLMNEIHRCLRSGGRFIAVTPAFPSPAAFQDPTHINFITIETAMYFAGSEPWAKSLGYGYVGEFRIVQNKWLRGSGPISHRHLLGELRTGSLRERTWASLRLMKRVLFLYQKKPTHLLWVLEKI